MQEILNTILTRFSCGHLEYIPLDKVNSCRCSKCESTGLRVGLDTKGLGCPQSVLGSEGQVENLQKSRFAEGQPMDGSSPAPDIQRLIEKFCVC